MRGIYTIHTPHSHAITLNLQQLLTKYVMVSYFSVLTLELEVTVTVDQSLGQVDISRSPIVAALAAEVGAQNGLPVAFDVERHVAGTFAKVY